MRPWELGSIENCGQLLSDRSRVPSRWRPADGTVPVSAVGGLVPRSLRPAARACRRLTNPRSPVWLPRTGV